MISRDVSGYMEIANDQENQAGHPPFDAQNKLSSTSVNCLFRIEKGEPVEQNHI